MAIDRKYFIHSRAGKLGTSCVSTLQDVESIVSDLEKRRNISSFISMAAMSGVILLGEVWPAELRQSSATIQDDRAGASSHSGVAMRVTTVFRRCFFVLTLMLSGPVMAAGFTCAPADSGKKSALDELDEVVITGEQAATDPKDMRAWLRLLVGQYTYEGHVDLCGRNRAKDLRPVTGKANCFGSGVTPNVQCTVNVRWPAARGDNGVPVLGGVSNSLPALVVYSLEVYNQYTHSPEGHGLMAPGEDHSWEDFNRQLYSAPRHWRIMFMQLDNKGNAEWGAGVLAGDTFVSREPCVGIPGACQKITRITAKSDSNEIYMVTDVEVDSRRVLRQSFLLHRNPAAEMEGRGGARP